MKAFLDDDFLLTTSTARRLYQVARSMPILDYHCHLDPKEIAQDRRFENITQVWLGGDHYKWRLMRANGVDESRSRLCRCCAISCSTVAACTAFRRATRVRKSA